MFSLNLHSACYSFHHTEVTIGFIPESSLVLEMNGTITVSVGVIAGQIDHGVTVEVRLFTEDLTATGKPHDEHCMAPCYWVDSFQYMMST